ncbi:MAG: S9 family peptidase [Caldilineaceae bacterium]
MLYDFTRYLNIRSAIDAHFVRGSDRVIFLCDVSGNYQVWSVGIGNEVADVFPQQVSFLPDKVWELHVSPAGDLLAVSDAGGNENQQFYRIQIDKGANSSQLQHSIQRITQRDDVIYRFGAWSADGSQLVYTCNERSPRDFDLWLMNLQNGESRLLKQASGNRTIVDWSPDGRTVVSVDALSSLQMELFVLDIESGEERKLTEGQPEALYPLLRWAKSGLYTITDQTHDLGALCRIDPSTGDLQELLRAADFTANGEFEHLTIAEDGRLAVLSLNEDGFNQLYRLDLETLSYEALPSPGVGVIGALRFDESGRRLLFNWQSATQNSNLWLLDLQTHELRQLTFFDFAGIAPSSLGAPELIRFATFDQRQIPAWYFTPVTPAPSGGYPCILYVHGGPAAQLRPEFDVRFQYFLNHGYAILATNVRGSTGYGRIYTALDEVELRMDSVTDLKYAVEWLHQRPEINSSRIGIYGRSYGGFMVLAAITEYPELFAAAVDVVGIANWVTFLEKTAVWRRAHRESEYGSLAHHRALLERISPIHKIERVRCPLHVQAGDNDPRVPLYESEQLVARLKAHGGTVEFVHYADEGHMFSKLSNRIDSFTKMAEFLQKVL